LQMINLIFFQFQFNFHHHYTGDVFNFRLNFLFNEII